MNEVNRGIKREYASENLKPAYLFSVKPRVLLVAWLAELGEYSETGISRGRIGPQNSSPIIIFSTVKLVGVHLNLLFWIHKSAALSSRVFLF